MGWPSRVGNGGNWLWCMRRCSGAGSGTGSGTGTVGCATGAARPQVKCRVSEEAAAAGSSGKKWDELIELRRQ